MATQVMIDLRRTDLRSNVLETPYWITSADIDWTDAEDLAAVAFSFPEDKVYFIHQMLVEVTEAFAGGTASATIGIGSLATDAITTGGDVTTVDLDEYFLNDSLALGALGIKMANNGTNSDYGAAWILGSLSSPTASAEMLIQGASTTVPCVVVYAVSTTSLTAGTLKIHMQISEIPGA